MLCRRAFICHCVFHRNDPLQGRSLWHGTVTHVWLVPWILPALKTRAQYKSNNHLTGGSARPNYQVKTTHILHTVDKKSSDAKLGFLGKPGFCHVFGQLCQIMINHVESRLRGTFVCFFCVCLVYVQTALMDTRQTEPGLEQPETGVCKSKLWKTGSIFKSAPRFPVAKSEDFML